MKFLTHTILHRVMSKFHCPNGDVYAEHVTDIASMKQVLDGAIFNMDLRPMTDPSQIDPNLLCDIVIQTFKEYGSTTTKTLKDNTTDRRCYSGMDLPVTEDSVHYGHRHDEGPCCYHG
jgi:hypothetical protein